MIGRCRPILALIPALIVSACDDASNVSSEFVPTSDMYAQMHLTADDSGFTTADVQLQRGSATSNVYLDLNEGDQLWLSAGETIDNVDPGSDLFDAIGDLSGTHTRLHEGIEIEFRFLFFHVRRGEVWYDGKLPVHDPAIPLRVALRRSNNGADAPDSIVSLPDAFAITAPLVHELYSRTAGDIVVNWSPSGTSDDMELNVSSVCTDGSTDDFNQRLTGDTGSYTLAAGALSGLTGDCSTRIALTRSRLGNLDSAYGVGGRIVAHQVRGVTVNTTD